MINSKTKYRKSNLGSTDTNRTYRDNNISYLPYCFDNSKNKPLQWLFKRLFDIILSIVALLLLSPVLLLTAMAIKLDTRGSVFFKQKRIGFLGKEFYMYKFRSMYVDAEDKLQELISKNETNNKMFKIFNDPRITRVGRFIRKFSIDELPQLYNVLKGDMSFVGFRPPLPMEVDRYQKRHMIRFLTMPGITGIWQVSGRSNIKDFDKVMELEKNYILNWNLVSDFYLMLKTIPVVLLAKGAY